MIEVGSIRVGVYGQAILLEPGVGNLADWRLILVSADVHRAADDARVAVKVDIGGHITVVSRIDAGRVELEMKIAPRQIHKERLIGDVVGTAAKKHPQRRGAAVDQCPPVAVTAIVIVYYTVIKVGVEAGGGPAANLGRIARERAIVERGVVGPTAGVGSGITRQSAVVERALEGPAALVATRIISQQAVIECAPCGPAAVGIAAGGVIARESAVVERARCGPAAHEPSRIRHQHAVVECGGLRSTAVVSPIARERAITEGAKVDSAAARSGSIADDFAIYYKSISGFTPQASAGRLRGSVR